MAEGEQAPAPVPASFNDFVVAGDAAKVEEAIANGADVNEVTGDRNVTPLHRAAHYNHVEVIKVLLSHKAKLDALDTNGRSPLHWAAFHVGCQASVAALLEAGAAVNQQDVGGQTPLIGACKGAFLETCQLLLDNKGNPAIADNQARLCIHVAGNVCADLRQVEKLKFLLRKAGGTATAK